MLRNFVMVIKRESKRCIATVTEHQQRRLTSEQIHAFRRDGFVAVPNFWSKPELCALRCGLTLLQANGKLANVATMGDGETHTEKPLNLQLCPLSPELKLFEALPFHPKVAESISELLCDSDEESVHCYLSQTFWKPPKEGLGTSWHQDNAYFRVPDAHAHKGTAMWTAVHDATISNGTIEMVTGYGSSLLEHKRDGTSDHHITCRDAVDESKAIPVELPAGGVVFFNFATPHCTRRNTSDSARAGIAYHFLHSDYYIERQFPLPEGAEYVAPVICGSQCTHGRAEYGRDVACFADEVDAVLNDPLYAAVDSTTSPAAPTFKTVKQDKTAP